MPLLVYRGMVGVGVSAVTLHNAQGPQDWFPRHRYSGQCCSPQEGLLLGAARRPDWLPTDLSWPCQLLLCNLVAFCR